MAQINSKYQEVRVPFTKMSFTPDIPSTQLGPNEYNSGLNVECDVRGIRSVAGDQEILPFDVPGTPTYVSSGFRLNGEFWFIVATTEGNWYASNGGGWINITPGDTPFAGYSQSINITEAWNGTVPFFNDGLNPPMFLPDFYTAKLVPYSNTKSLVFTDIQTVSSTVQKLILQNTQPAAPYIAGQSIIITGINNFFNGTFVVVSATTTSISYTASPGAAYPGGTGNVSPKYSWNYTTDSELTAGFMRMYSTPNVGSILIAGNLSTVSVMGGIPSPNNLYPVTIQWSQAFGLNEAPLSWEPTVLNVANQLEVPLRGPALDGFPCNGQFFVCSYWDTVVFSPINYSTTNSPILGVRLFNQGRGLLSANCWSNTDKLVYGVDARDIWAFDGTNFTGLGNQQVKNWFFDQLAPEYYNRVFVQNNSQKNQIEIYYPDSEAVNGVPNKMLAYRYDLQLFNAPREVDSATMACESPIYTEASPNFGSRTIVYARGKPNEKLVQKDVGYTWADGSPIESSFRRDNIKLLKDYSGKLMVHRILPEVNNMGAIPYSATHDYNITIDPAVSTHKGNVTVTIEGANSVGSSPTVKTPVTMPVDANGTTVAQSPWCQIDQNAFRVNNIEISNSSNNSVWICSATTWQVTQVEDDR